MIHFEKTCKKIVKADSGNFSNLTSGNFVLGVFALSESWIRTVRLLVTSLAERSPRLLKFLTETYGYPWSQYQKDLDIEISWSTFGEFCIWNLGLEKLRETPRRLPDWLTSIPSRQKLFSPHATFTQAWLQNLNSSSTWCYERSWLSRQKVATVDGKVQVQFLQVFEIRQHSVVVDRPLLRIFLLLCVFFLTCKKFTKFTKSRQTKVSYCPSRCQLWGVLPGVSAAFWETLRCWI